MRCKLYRFWHCEINLQLITLTLLIQCTSSHFRAGGTESAFCIAGIAINELEYEKFSDVKLNFALSVYSSRMQNESPITVCYAIYLCFFMYCIVGPMPYNLFSTSINSTKFHIKWLRFISILQSSNKFMIQCEYIKIAKDNNTHSKESVRINGVHS